jgi:hypothetical protein
MRYVIGLILSLLVAAGIVLLKPRATPEPTPEPPAPATPEPTPPPRPVLDAPETAVVGMPFTVSYCQPYVANTRLYIDEYFLGTMGHDNRSGCIMLKVVLNTPGERVLKVGDMTRPIKVITVK